METLRNFWEIIAPYFSGGVAGALISVIVIPIIRGMLTKTTEKLNIDGLLEKHKNALKEVADEAVDRIKNLAFKQSIQPIVESELMKITEQANAYIAGEVGELRYSNEKIVTAIAALGAYFDDSIVPDAKKQAFRDAIEAAKAPITEQEITVQETIVEDNTAAPAAKKTAKKSEVIR